MISRAYPGMLRHDEVEDVYANAWVGTLRALESRQHRLTDDELRSYLLAAAANQAIKEARRRNRKPVESLDSISPEVIADWHGAVPEDRAIAAEDVAIARDVMSSLPPRRRSVMLLRYGWGLNPEQVCAKVKGLSRRAYRHEITRGVEQLAASMKTFESGELCRDRAALLHAFAAGETNREETLQVRTHLGHCRSCAAHVAELRRTLQSLKVAVPVPILIDSFLSPSGSAIAGKFEGVREFVNSVSESLAAIAGRIRAVEPGGSSAAEAAGGTVAAGGAVAGGALVSAGAGKVIAGCVVGVSACAVIGLGGKAVIAAEAPVPRPVETGIVAPAVEQSEPTPLPVPAAGDEAPDHDERQQDGDGKDGQGKADERPLPASANEFDPVERAAQQSGSSGQPSTAPPATGSQVQDEFGLP